MSAPSVYDSIPDFGSEPLSRQALQRLAERLDQLSRPRMSRGSFGSFGSQEAEGEPYYFLAKVDGSLGGSPPGHSWHEVCDERDATFAATNSTLSDQSGGAPLYDINGAAVATGTLVVCWKGTGDFYLCDAGQAGNALYGEIPSGTVDGVNTVFTISQTPADVSTTDVFRNGVRQTLTTHYTLSGVTITFVTAPPVGSVLYVRYGVATSAGTLGSVRLNGPVYYTESSSVTIAGNTNDYTLPAGAPGVQLNPTGSGYLLTGIAGGTAGRTITLTNVNSSNALGLPDSSGSSTAGNRWKVVGGGTYWLQPGESVRATYDGILGAWVLDGVPLYGQTGLYIGPSVTVSSLPTLGSTNAYQYVSTTRYHPLGLERQGASYPTFGNPVTGDLSGYFWSPGRSGTIDKLGIFINAPDAGMHGRVGVYALTSATDPEPAALLLDSGAISLTTGSAFAMATVSLTVTRGTPYLLAFITDSTLPANYTELSYQDAMAWAGIDSSSTNPVLSVGWYKAAVGYGALPNPFPSTPTALDSTYGSRPVLIYARWAS